MGKVVEPFGAIKAVGSVGGVTATRSGSGQGMKSKGGRVDPATPVQQAGRAALQTASRGYQDLSVEEQDAWIEFGKLWPEENRCGILVALTGANWYVRLNWHRGRAGLSAVTAPPVGPGCDYLPTVHFRHVPEGIRMVVEPWPAAEELIYVSRCGVEPISRLRVPESRKFFDYLEVGSDWPFYVWLDGDLHGEWGRYFFVYRTIDSWGRASSERIAFVDGVQVGEMWQGAAEADASVSEMNPNTNYPVGAVMRSDLEITEYWGFLMRWDVSGIPVGAKVLGARIFLWCVGIDSPWHRVPVHEVLKQWAENQVTWNVRLTGVPWGKGGGEPGVDFKQDVEDIGFVDDHQLWFNWDVTEMVAGWVADAASNYGAWFRWGVDGGDESYGSREWPEVEHRPFLAVAYR